VTEPVLSEDRVLGGRVLLRQPVAGFRAAIDPVLLAAAVPAEGEARVLELGAGTGAASLCLARRVEGCRITGLELQPDLAAIAAGNAVLNGLEARVSFLAGDILDPPAALAPGSFDHVMANPPYLASGTATLPPGAARALAVGEGEADLARWVEFALSRVRPRGSVTFIHRADRLADLLAALAGRAGEIAILPLWPGPGKSAKRIILRARRGIESPLRLLPGLTLHGPGGGYSPDADAILRDAAALSF